ncbi:hypothetical protein FQA39_LY19263 [Lamprigera yunnana]|nr:hypothetical protein FQA39_LY19263 [Lamprigera yunnana]
MVGIVRDCRGQRRKVGMTSNHHAPYVLGFTHATMAGTMGCDTARWSESQKAGLSSDWGLQLDPMKSESLVIADQQRCGEYVPGPCTHRRHVMKVVTPKPWPNALWEGVSRWIGDWERSRTREHGGALAQGADERNVGAAICSGAVTVAVIEDFRMGKPAPVMWCYCREYIDGVEERGVKHLSTSGRENNSDFP